MNSELLDIGKKLLDEYGSGDHWEIVKAEKVELMELKTTGWTLTIQPAKDGGAANESNK